MSEVVKFNWKSKFERLLHEALVLNEIGRPETAYKLSWAGTPESGYSYGFAQFDLAAGGAQPRRAFLGILRKAAETDAVLAAALPRIETAIAKTRGKMTASQRALIEDNKRRINKALASDEGRKVITGLHIEHMEKLEQQVNPLRDLANDNAKAFLRSVEGRVYIADYCNQFGAPNTFGRYIQGQTVTIGGKRKSLTEKLTVPVWTDYIMSTTYAQKHPRDIRRRLGNIAKVIVQDAERGTAVNPPASGVAATMLRELARNNLWSNDRLHRACAKLREAEYLASRPAFFGSIHNTLNHILQIDRLYFDRLRGLRPEAPDFGERLHDDLARISAAQRETDRRLVKFVDGLDDDSLQREVAWVSRGGVETANPLHAALLHLFTHQMHHRGQVHDMLAQTDVAPPQLDEFFLAEDMPRRARELQDLDLS